MFIAEGSTEWTLDTVCGGCRTQIERAQRRVRAAQVKREVRA